MGREATADLFSHPPAGTLPLPCGRIGDPPVQGGAGHLLFRSLSDSIAAGSSRLPLCSAFPGSLRLRNAKEFGCNPGASG